MERLILFIPIILIYIIFAALFILGLCHAADDDGGK